MNLARALRVVGAPAIAFTGAGGKTTAMFELARGLPGPVLVTTTTHLGERQASLADQHIIAGGAADVDAAEFHGVTLITGPARDGRLQAISPETFRRLDERRKTGEMPLLIEADGSRGRPLKAPAEHEPVVPAFSDQVVVTAGLSALGQKLDDEHIFRAERVVEIAHATAGQNVTADVLAEVLMNPAGGLKGLPARARRTLLLNQADTDELQAIARGLTPRLLGAFSTAVIASLQAHAVHAAYEATAAIVLAAGGSTRFGSPKPLLDWRGEPFVRAVVRRALEAGISDVTVVTGSRAGMVESALGELPVRIVRNADWPSGQASSIAAGLRSLPQEIGAAIFLLVDQPHITSAVLQALVEYHAGGLFPIVAPLVMMEQRANPVLFDRDVFPDLLSLTGDVGGRAIFGKHRVEFMPWHDDRLLLDVDKPEDYQRLLADDTL
jgi:molybdenum cofactor cytidylyltransferase